MTDESHDGRRVPMTARAECEECGGRGVRMVRVPDNPDFIGRGTYSDRRVICGCVEAKP